MIGTEPWRTLLILRPVWRVRLRRTVARSTTVLAVSPCRPSHLRTVLVVSGTSQWNATGTAGILLDNLITEQMGPGLIWIRIFMQYLQIATIRNSSTSFQLLTC